VLILLKNTFSFLFALFVGEDFLPFPSIYYPIDRCSFSYLSGVSIPSPFRNQMRILPLRPGSSLRRKISLPRFFSYNDLGEFSPPCPPSSRVLPPQEAFLLQCSELSKYIASSSKLTDLGSIFPRSPNYQSCSLHGRRGSLPSLPFSEDNKKASPPRLD